MKHWFSLPLFFAVLFLSIQLSRQPAMADHCDEMLINESGERWSPQERQQIERNVRECKEKDKTLKAEQAAKGKAARESLKKEFNIDASGMSDLEAVSRLENERRMRKDAAREAKERKSTEDAAKRDAQMQDVMRQQDAMFKGVMGRGLDEVPEDDAAAEEVMYQRMLDGGVAPQCRGQKGSALADCMEKALGDEGN